MGRTQRLVSPTISKPYSLLPDLIGAIGEEGFGSQLLNFLANACGAEHCAVFRFIDQTPVGVAAASIDGTDTALRQVHIYIDRKIWKTDPLLSEANQLVGRIEPSLLKMDVLNLPDNELRHLVYEKEHIRERILMCGDISGTRVGLSLLRSEERGPFDTAEIQNLTSISATLLSILVKHAGICLEARDLSVALTTLSEMEACILAAPERLPRREAEVCARILYGISTAGIALDLNIGEETVMTYRKRAYQRLEIACQRELLLWYLSLWSRTPHFSGRIH